MCSILGIFEISGDLASVREQALQLSSIQRHRGPDWSGVYADDGAVLAHERLAIVDVIHGAQPLISTDGTKALAVNGEIYNHWELRDGLEAQYDFTTDSDCEVILPLYLERGTDFLDSLNGIYAFILRDAESDRYVVARDPMGVVPLYMGWDLEGRVYFASEMKALVTACHTVREFPPGHVLDSAVGPDPVRWYHREWRDFEWSDRSGAGAPEIRAGLESAVHRQLMSDVPYGVLLSGGLDSSIVAAIAARFAARRVEDDGQSTAWWPQLHSFCIGLDGAPDLAAARAVAEHIGSTHHEFHFTVQEGLDALTDVIRHLETYDVTTVRASTPMYLMARRIRAMGVKMVLSGEGADEIFGGYLYFHHAPSAREFHEETVRKLDRLHLYDCLRANKSMAAWGVEARVPFLDRDFLDLAMGMDPAKKMIVPGGAEKQVLRDAFADLLPKFIVERQKEQFSDGVGYGWIDALRDHAEAKVSEADMARAAVRFPVNTPPTKEAYFYRSIFDGHFPLASAAECVPGGASVACSTAEALAWNPEFGKSADPSGRAVRGVHQEAYS